MHMHFCENQVIDSVISYYCALAERNTIPFHVQIDLPAQISVDETDFCLVLSNLLENALEQIIITPQIVSTSMPTHWNKLREKKNSKKTFQTICMTIFYKTCFLSKI